LCAERTGGNGGKSDGKKKLVGEDSQEENISPGVNRGPDGMFKQKKRKLI